MLPPPHRGPTAAAVYKVLSLGGVPALRLLTRYGTGDIQL